MERGDFVAVHCGAGSLPKKYVPTMKQLCMNSCRQASEQFACKSAIQICANTVSELEDCPLTNAGTGSNLSAAEVVQCDASIMDGKTLTFGAVGAMECVKNPIKVAHKLELQYANSNGPLVPPNCLVSDGAKEFAGKVGLEICRPMDMISETSLSSFRSALRKLDNKLDVCHEALDTVGCVVLKNDGSCAAGCSSGGLLLKLNGRVGSAGVYGSGIWAETRDKYAVAVSASGCGEYLTKTQFSSSLARKIAQNYRGETLAEILYSFFKNDFVNSDFLKFGVQKTQILAGVIVIFLDKVENCAEFAYCHNAEQFTVGCRGRSVGKFEVSTLSDDSEIVVRGRRIR